MTKNTSFFNERRHFIKQTFWLGLLLTINPLKMFSQDKKSKITNNKITNMKAVVIGEIGKIATKENIMEAYPRHRAVVDKFVGQGDIIAKGRFVDATDGNMLIFKNRKAAEQYVKEDAYILEGIIGTVVIRDWAENMLPE